MYFLIASSLVTLAYAAPTSAVADFDSSPVASSQTKGFLNPTISSSVGGKAMCVSGIVPVTANTTSNVHLNLGLPANQSVVTQVFVDMFTAGSNYTAQTVGKPTTVSGTYNISAALCFPVSGVNATTVQFLTHGIGFDRSYWNFTADNSYIDEAANAGYTTFLYDRLGVGNSATPDPIQIVQAPFEVEIAHSLIQSLKNGCFATKFSNVVGVGHSFGSALTVGITHQHTSDFQALVLTAFSMNNTGNTPFTSGLDFDIASQNQPQRFSRLNNGYLVTSTIYANQYGFYHFPGYNPDNLVLAEATKATTTLGEMFTTSIVNLPAPGFTGPVGVFNGLYDLRFCDGNCLYPSDLGANAISTLFPAAKKTSVSKTYAGAGHALNIHYNATMAFLDIQSFVKGNGL